MCLSLSFFLCLFHLRFLLIGEGQTKDKCTERERERERKKDRKKEREREREYTNHFVHPSEVVKRGIIRELLIKVFPSLR